MDGYTPWPDDLARQYEKAGYWQGLTLGEALAGWAEGFGARTALVAGDGRLTYCQLADAIDSLAAGLLDHGLGPGARVVVQLPNGADFVILLGALQRIGAVPVMALPAHRRREISHFVDIAEATALVIPESEEESDYRRMATAVAAEFPALRLILSGGAGDREWPGIAALARVAGPARLKSIRQRLAGLAIDPALPALFLLSGGTTGLPKLIPRTGNDYGYNYRACAAASGVGPDTVYMVSLPAAHNFPLACPGILGVLAAGGRVVMAPSPRPEVALPLIARERITMTAVVPAIAIRWMERAADIGADLSTLSLLQVGGARLNPEAARRIRPTLGCTLQQVFGMAEGLICMTRPDDPEEIIVNTQGRPVSKGDEIRIVDAADKPLPPGMAGELLTRGPYTICGYFRAADHNRRAFTGDGHYRSGDIVVADGAGNLSVAGRLKDMINRGGEKISAEEIENLMLAHPAIVNAAAIAMPDALLGERICACVELRPGQSLDLNALVAFMETAEIARFKLPERLEIYPALPLTTIGKIDKKTLRRDIAEKPER